MGGGGMCPQDFSSYFSLIFHPNQPKHHLKWKLASLSACRVFEHHSKLHSFVVRWRRSSLLWPRKFSSFRYHNFWKFVIFDLHGQYVHQMKAENILNSYLTSKNTICFEKFAKKLIFQKKIFSFDEIFFFVTQIFRIFLYTPPIFFFIHVFYRW